MEERRRSGRIVINLGIVFSASLLLFLLLTFIELSAANAVPPAEQIPLNGCLDVCDLNRGDDGLLYVSDYDAGEIWQIQPTNGTFTLYEVQDQPIDARPDGSGNIWWTDGAESFSRLVPATNLQTSWVFSNFESFNGLAFDDAGDVWFVESFGSGSKIHRFDPDSDELCSYAFGGTYSYHLLYGDGGFWFLNWFAEEIVRFDPGTKAVERWHMTAPVRDPWALDIDAQGDVWWSDRTNRLFRLEPTDDRQTVYELPVGTGAEIRGIEARNGLIWYAEHLTGTIGALNPAEASGISGTLTTEVGTAAESCQFIAPEDDVSTTSQTGSIAWSDLSLTTAYQGDGWTIYQLPVGSKPYDLSSAADHQWATDTGNRQLLRFALTRNGQLSLDVEAEPTTIYHDGTITYTYQLSYTSNDGTPANSVSLVDDVCQSVAYSSGDANGDSLLDVTETWVYTCSYMVPAHQDGEVNPISNTATASASDFDDQSISAIQDSASVTITHRLGTLSINKYGPAKAKHGDIISFTYVISYDSLDIGPAQNVIVDDDSCSPLFGPATGSDLDQDGYLDVGESWLYSCEFEIPDHDDQEEDPLINTATVHGQNLDGNDLESAMAIHKTDILHDSDYRWLFLPLVLK